MGYYNPGAPGLWFGLIMFFIMLVFFAFVVAGVILLLRRGFRHNGHHHMGYPGNVGSSNAQAILDERFARGEIDIDDYNARKEALKNQ